MKKMVEDNNDSKIKKLAKIFREEIIYVLYKKTFLLSNKFHCIKLEREREREREVTLISSYNILYSLTSGHLSHLGN